MKQTDLLQRKITLQPQCQEKSSKFTSQSLPASFLGLVLAEEVGSELEAGSHGGHIPDGKIILFLDTVTQDLAAGKKGAC